LQRPTVLLDEPLFGLDEYLRDLGWTTTKVRPGISDDEVVKLARENKYIVVSPDRKLLSRCRVMGIPLVDLGLEVQARIVHESLQKIMTSQGTFEQPTRS
jgi:rRNA-processing protein FCF1